MGCLSEIDMHRKEILFVAVPLCLNCFGFSKTCLPRSRKSDNYGTTGPES